MKHLTLTKTYFLWIIVSIVAMAISWQSGDLVNLMGQAVDQAGVTELPREELIIGFIAISIIYAVVMFMLSGIFVIFTNKQKTWAKYLLSIFCLYQLSYEVYFNMEVLRKYDFSFGIGDWFLSLCSVLLVIYMGVIPHLKSNLNNS